MSEFDKFLQKSGLTFEEYKSWFSNLQIEDEVLRNNRSECSTRKVKEVFSSNQSIMLDTEDKYSIKEKQVFHSYNGEIRPAAAFPVPNPEQIKQIKQKRLSILQLKVGETYEDSEGSEWFVEDEPAKVEQPAEKLKQRPELTVGQVWSLRDSQEGTIIFEPYKGVFEILCHESNISTLVEKSSSELSVYLRETDRPKLEIGKLYKKKNGSIVTIEESKPNGEREIYWGSDAHWYTQFGFKAFHRNGSKEDLVEEVVSLKVGQIYQDRKGGEWVVMSRIDKNKSEDCFKFACRSLSQDISYYFSKNGRFAPSMNEHSLDLIKLIKNTEEGAAMPTEEIVKVEVIDEFAEVDSFFQSVKNNKLELKSLREENESLKSDLAKTVYDRNEMGEQLGLETSKNQDLLKKQQELNDYIANLEDQVHASRKDLDSEIELTSLFQAEIKTLEESKQVQETKYGKVCAENYELRQIIKRLEDHCDHLQKQVGICLKQEFILLGTKRTLENDILALTTENVRLAKKLKALETILEPDHK